MTVVLLAATILCSAVAAGQSAPSSSVAQAVEVHASLLGFNLLWPSSRCCAFTLHLAPSGDVTTTLQLDKPVTRTSRATPEELTALRRALDESRFFSLPADVGMLPVDGDEHRMEVRLGGRSHRVTLYDWPDDWGNASYMRGKELERTRRAYAVWSIIRSLVKDERATVP
jgi:hypothetical protein